MPTILKNTFTIKVLMVFTFAFLLQFSVASQRAMNNYHLDVNSIHTDSCSGLHALGEFVELKVDSSFCIADSYPLKIQTTEMVMYGFKIKGKSRFFLQQYVPLLDLCDSISISFSYKSNYQNKARMIVALINQQDSVCKLDTIRLWDNTEYEEVQWSLESENVKQAIIQLLGDSVPSHDENNAPFSFGLSNISIDAFGKVSATGEANSINTNLAESQFDIEDALKNARVIGIAETMHGSATINQHSFQIIRQLIERDSCKLVVFELPTNFVLMWDKFVCGDERIDISNVLDNYSVYSEKETLDFLMWLKRFNSSAKKKVHLAGMDVANGTETQKLMLYDLLNFTIDDKIVLAQVVDSLLTFNAGNNESFYDFLRNNETVKQSFGSVDYELLLHALANSIQTRTDARLIINRDEYMFDNFNYLLSHYEIAEHEKVAIYAHWVHLNKMKTFFPDGLTASLGSYIDNTYSDRYYVIGMHAGNGSITNTTKKEIFNTAQLSEPVMNSIESICLNAGVDSSFINAGYFPESVYLRLEGTPMKNCNDFYLINPGSRMDAVYFVRNSKGMPIPENRDLALFRNKRLYDILLKEEKRRREMNNR